MQAVIETPEFLIAAARVRLSEDERLAIVNHYASEPQDGALIAGTGGARKLRFAGRGKGKSGGYRVISFYAGEDIPVFLLAMYGKGEKENLSKAERNELRKILTALPDAWRTMVKERAAKPRA